MEHPARFVAQIPPFRLDKIAEVRNTLAADEREEYEMFKNNPAAMEEAVDDNDVVMIEENAGKGMMMSLMTLVSFEGRLGNLAPPYC